MEMGVHVWYDGGRQIDIEDDFLSIRWTVILTKKLARAEKIGAEKEKSWKDSEKIIDECQIHGGPCPFLHHDRPCHTGFTGSCKRTDREVARPSTGWNQIPPMHYSSRHQVVKVDRAYKMQKFTTLELKQSTTQRGMLSNRNQTLCWILTDCTLSLISWVDLVALQFTWSLSSQNFIEITSKESCVVRSAFYNHLAFRIIISVPRNVLFDIIWMILLEEKM